LISLDDEGSEHGVASVCLNETAIAKLAATHLVTNSGWTLGVGRPGRHLEWQARNDLLRHFVGNIVRRFETLKAQLATVDRAPARSPRRAGPGILLRRAKPGANEQKPLNQLRELVLTSAGVTLVRKKPSWRSPRRRLTSKYLALPQG